MYWTARDQPWRGEPEIDANRQEELRKRLAIVPNVEKGIYPFRGMKLSRADVEWLLAIHENGRGPVNWDDPSQRDRIGIGLLRWLSVHVPLPTLSWVCITTLIYPCYKLCLKVSRPFMGAFSQSCSPLIHPRSG